MCYCYQRFYLPIAYKICRLINLFVFCCLCKIESDSHQLLVDQKAMSACWLVLLLLFEVVRSNELFPIDRTSVALQPKYFHYNIFHS